MALIFDLTVASQSSVLLSDMLANVCPFPFLLPLNVMYDTDHFLYGVCMELPNSYPVLFLLPFKEWKDSMPVLHILDTILVHCILHILGTILVHCLI